MGSLPNSLSGKRILIVEDEYLLADDLSETLTDAGAEIVGPVATVAEANELADAQGFDCAVLDMNLEGQFAFALAQRLKNEGVPFVVATGYGEDVLPEALRDEPRIEKPYVVSKMVNALVRLTA